ncbi:MAG: hypothetical protein IID44_23170 [Planctomycetes bacterium]|nr:hypothetical protein [Planctomycetota bacterium]
MDDAGSPGVGMSAKRQRHTLVYPKDQLTPEDLLNFWELPWFVDAWNELKLSDDDLSALQISIMCNPRAAPVIAGTKGLRKLRFSPPAWRTGKSGALRICYVYFEKYGHVLLVIAYRKNEMKTISQRAKKSINVAIERIEKEMGRVFGF